MKKFSIFFTLLLAVYATSCIDGFVPKVQTFYFKGRTVDSLGNPIPNVSLHFDKVQSMVFMPTKLLDSLSFKTDANGNFSFARDYQITNPNQNDCDMYHIFPKGNIRLTKHTLFSGECNGDSIIFRQLIFAPK